MNFQRVLLGILMVVTPYSVSAEDVVINSARFDAQGRLVVKVSEVGTENCYLTVYGGLTRKSVDTAIIGRLATGAEVLGNRAAIRTRRRYYCKKRTLLVNVQRLCTDDTPPSTSDTVEVSVPAGNVKR